MKKALIIIGIKLTAEMLVQLSKHTKNTVDDDIAEVIKKGADVLTPLIRKTKKVH